MPYFHCPGVSRWVQKGENNFVIKEKFSKMHVWGANLSMGVIISSFIEGNMDCQKYLSILENNINKTKGIHQKLEILMR